MSSYAQIKQLLAEGKTVDFSYTRKDGVPGEAKATTNAQLIEELLPKDPAAEAAPGPAKAPRKPSETSVTYFDIEKKAWRAVSEVNEPVLIKAYDGLQP